MIRPIDTADLILACLAIGVDDYDSISRVAGILGLDQRPSLPEMCQGASPFISIGMKFDQSLGPRAPVGVPALEDAASSCIISQESDETAGTPRRPALDLPVTAAGGISVSPIEAQKTSRWRNESSAPFRSAKRPLTVSLIRSGTPMVLPDEAGDGGYAVAGSPVVPTAIVGTSAPSPLVPDRFVRAWLHDLCARRLPIGRIDESRLAERLARGLSIDHIPRKWAAKLVEPPIVLAELSDDTAALHSDMLRLVSATQVTLGSSREAIHFLALQDDVDELLAAIGREKAWQGRTVLILTDLCAGGFTADIPRRSLYRVVRALSRAKASITIVSARTRPLPYWIRALPEVRVRSWSPRGSEMSVREEHLRMIAAMLIMADRPSLALLRELRQMLLPQYGVEVEAALLHSSYVAGTMGARIVIQARACVAAASELGDPASCATMLKVLQECGDAAASGVNEILVAAWSGHDLRAEQMMKGLSRGLHGGGESLADLARHAASLVTRLPQRIAKLALTRLVALQARLALNLVVPLELTNTAAENTWLFPTRTAIGIYWAGERLVFRDRPRCGDVLMDLPETQPRQLYLLDEKGEPTFHYALWRSGRLVVPMPQGSSDWKTLDGTVYRVDEVDDQSAWERLYECMAHGTVIRGAVRLPVRRERFLDGYLVDVGVLGFLPMHLSKTGIFDVSADFKPAPAIGVRVIECVQHTRHLILEENDLPPNEENAEISVMPSIGDVVRGTVISMGRVFAIVNIDGGLRGRVLSNYILNQFGSANGVNPTVLGGTNEFVVKSISEGQMDFRLLPKEIDDLLQKHSETLVKGSVHYAQVIDVGDAGWLLRMNVGLTGLLPRNLVPRVSWHRLEFGKELEVILVRISKSFHELTFRLTNSSVSQPSALDLQRPAVGDIVTGTIESITDYGAFIRLDQFNINALLHINEMGWRKVNKVPEKFKTGQKLTVKVLSMDVEKNRISLSLKQMTPDPWMAPLSQIKIGQTLEGQVLKIVEYGVFVELLEGVEGLLHASSLGMVNGKKFVVQSQIKYPRGTSLRVRVTELDRERRRIGLELVE